MKKLRSKLSATEIVQLQDFLSEKLQRIGVQSQPEVAIKVLDLSSRPDAHPKDYAAVIKNDPALCGRLLRLANSAMFAQRKAVTSIDRSCLVLGLERLKAVALGFHLSRAAAGGGTREIARSAWGQSVYRACLAAELARQTAPALVPEAFVIGLMQDAGVPLMSRLVGAEYDAMYQACDSPYKLFRTEFDTFEFTHVDIVATLMRLWKLPELLAKPLEWHHDRPSHPTRPEPVHRLHRIAFVVGSLQIGVTDGIAQPLEEDAPGLPAAQRLLQIDNQTLSQVVKKTSAEYSTNIDLFAEIAMSVGNLDEMLDSIHLSLVRAIDARVERSIADEAGSRQRFNINGHTIELARDEDDHFVACLFDSSGGALVTHRFLPRQEGTEMVLAALGVESKACDDLGRMTLFIRAAAA